MCQILQRSKKSWKVEKSSLNSALGRSLNGLSKSSFKGVENQIYWMKKVIGGKEVSTVSINCPWRIVVLMGKQDIKVYKDSGDSVLFLTYFPSFNRSIFPFLWGNCLHPFHVILVRMSFMVPWSPELEQRNAWPNPQATGFDGRMNTRLNWGHLEWTVLCRS